MKQHRWLAVGLIIFACVFLTTGCRKKRTSPVEPDQPTGGNSGGGGGALGGGGGGAVQNIRQAAKRAADGGELKNFALAYLQYALTNGKGPTKIQDLQDSLTHKMVEAFQDDNLYVVNWKVANPTGSTILAYVKEPDSYGTRLVAKGDASVVRMNKDEFEAAMRGGR